jgi:CHASE3 domain sensor protein/serine phosphatase RsbU (regulator of sigma subunit)
VSLRLRLLWLLAVLVVVVVGSALLVNDRLEHVRENRKLVTGTLQPAGVQSRALLTALVDQETGQRGYVLTGVDEFLGPFRSGNRDFRLRIAELRSEFVGDAGMQSAIDRVDAAADRWHREGARPEIAARRNDGAAAAAQLVRSGRGKRAFDDVRARVEDLQRSIDRRTREVQLEATKDINLLDAVIRASRAVLVAFLVGSVLLLRRWMLRPVSRLRASMREVADGRLGNEVLAEGPPEVAAIGRDAESMRRRIVSELATAQAATEALTQHSPVVSGLRRELAPRPSPTTSGLDVAGVMLSAEGVLAGDWWEVVERPDGSTALIVADVSGHGAEAGLVALRFKQRVTALLDTDLELGAAFGIAATQRPDEDAERFLSCLVVAIDPAAGDVAWVNAGHPAGWLVSRRDPQRLVELEPTGPLISAVTAGWSVAHAPLHPDDMLVVCTDGILEARDAADEEFGTEGVLRVLRGLGRWAPEEAVAELTEAVRRFAVDVRRDDVTCVAVAPADRG